MKKFISIYTPSHAQMYHDYFFPSFNKYLSKDYKLLIEQNDQESLTGDYYSEGFKLTTLEKIKWIIKNIDITDPEEMIYSDVDIQFFKRLEYSMNDNDILFQWDFDNYCAGFMVFKQNQRILDLFKLVESSMKSDPELYDQVAINNSLKISSIKYDRLPIEKYWTAGNDKIWEGENFLLPTDKIIMHHANFIVGVRNKLISLEKIKNSMRALYENHSHNISM